MQTQFCFDFYLNFMYQVMIATFIHSFYNLYCIVFTRKTRKTDGNREGQRNQINKESLQTNMIHDCTPTGHGLWWGHTHPHPPPRPPQPQLLGQQAPLL